MIIGIDASRANKDHKTGTEWYAYYLIRWLAKLDSKNKYILYTDKPLSGGLLNLKTEQHYNESETSVAEYDKKGFQKLKSPHNNFRAKILKWPFSHLWTQGGLSLEMLLHKPDILFVPAHTLPFIHPKKSVVTIHDIGFERELRLFLREEMGSYGRKRRKIINIFVRLFTLGKYSANTIDYLKWSTKFAVKRAAKIITVSNFSKSEMRQLYKFPDSKVKVIYNGYNEFLYQRISDTVAVKSVLDKYGLKQPYLMYVGRIEKKKNISLLIEAFAIFKEKNPHLNHKLLLVGDASFGYDETKYMIREFDLVQDVFMPGWLAEEDLPYLYSGAFSFVFPSNYEGFGIPLLQAMACGVPIIASDSSSIPEVVLDAAYLFNPKYALSIAEAIEKVISNRELRKSLVEKGYKRVKNFSWEKSAQETLALLNSLDSKN